VLFAGRAACSLRHSALGFRAVGPADAGPARRRLPFITTLHGTDITLVGADRSYFPITKFLDRGVRRRHAISDYLRAATAEVFGATGEIRVIKNFVNCDMYQPDPSAATPRP